MVELSVHILAQLEHFEAIEYYGERSQQAARDYVVAFVAGVDAILATPDRFPRRDSRYRFLKLADFPYSIIYRYHRDRVRVVAVMHESRRPGYWRRRR